MVMTMVMNKTELLFSSTPTTAAKKMMMTIIIKCCHSIYVAVVAADAENMINNTSSMGSRPSPYSIISFFIIINASASSAYMKMRLTRTDFKCCQCNIIWRMLMAHITNICWRLL